MTGAVAGLVLSLGILPPPVTAVASEGYDTDSASSLQVVVNKHRQLNPAAYVPVALVRVQGNGCGPRPRTPTSSLPKPPRRRV